MAMISTQDPEWLRSLLEALRAARAGHSRVRLPGAQAEGVAGEVAGAFNALMDDLVQPLTGLTTVIDGLAAGDLDQRAPEGPALAPAAAGLGRAVNDLGARLREVSDELLRVMIEVSDEGKLGGHMRVPFAPGAWGELVGSVNGLIDRLTGEVRDIGAVTRAVARGDLSSRVQVDARGEVLELKQVINTMLEKLAALGGEVARVSRELEAEGPARGDRPGWMKDVGGVWKALTDNVVLAEQVAERSRSRSEMLASMGHELRTPLNSVLLLAGLLSENREANLTEPQLQLARTIQGSGRELLGLLNDLLDLSKIEAGMMGVVPAEVELDELVTLIERTYRPLAEQKGLSFTVIREAGLPGTLITDGQRLRQVLHNLVANALKFTSTGGVTLRLQPLADPGEAHLAFSVEDTGIGIAAADQERIFEPFQQAGAETSRTYGGTGLGLSISRRFASLLGGELRLRSLPGEGSTFTLLLPVRALTTPRTAPRASSRALLPTPPPPDALPATVEAVAGRRVLLVDDDALHLFALAGLLESQGMQVLVAEGGREALEVLERRGGVDLVLLDLVMPDLDGYATLGEIRRSQGQTAPPIIVVSGGASDGERARCLAEGAAEYLPKPVDPATMLAAIASRLGQAPPPSA